MRWSVATAHGCSITPNHYQQSAQQLLHWNTITLQFTAHLCHIYNTYAHTTISIFLASMGKAYTWAFCTGNNHIICCCGHFSGFSLTWLNRGGGQFIQNRIRWHICLIGNGWKTTRVIKLIELAMLQQGPQCNTSHSSVHTYHQASTKPVTSHLTNCVH